MTTGSESILFLQQFSTPFFDGLFHWVSFLGDEFFYFILLSFIYWCVDKKLGIRLSIVIFCSLYVNYTLKDFFHFPRPQGAGIRVMDFPEGESFPSGHAQSGATVSFFLARIFRKWWWYLLAGMITVLISLARVYLGVHYPRDVVVGALLGIFFAFFFSFIFQKRDQGKSMIPNGTEVVLSILGGCLLFLFSRNTLSVRVAGSLMGVLVGSFLEQAWVGFQEKATLLFQVIKYMGGMTSIIFLYLILKKIFPDHSFALFIRYFFLNFWIVFVVPFVFQRVKSRETRL
ncbi:MAG: phosphatase PAP2 family protein [Candidatus Atribacteria bacterium]|nr:phosphatase PAP2 family protein [Candidatus Atribacteria bacterium]